MFPFTMFILINQLREKYEMEQPQPIKEKAIFATQLGVVAALVDGEATQVELDTLTAKVSERFRVNAEEVTRLAKGMIDYYTNVGIATNPGVALHFAAKSLMSLSDFDKKIAFDIAEQVIISGGIDTKEKTFLSTLRNFTRV
jgi:hypothetical protein